MQLNVLTAFFMREKKALAIVLLISFLFIFAIPFEGEFGLNDDPEYTRAVKDFAFEGKYYAENYSSILLLQIFYGTIFVNLFGFSNTILRISVMLLSLLAPLLLFSISRVLGFTQKHSILFALVLLVNPFFVVLGHSFMTDVPFLVLILAAILPLVYWVKTNDLKAFTIGCIILFFAFFLKQWAVLFFAGLILFVFLSKTGKKEKIIIAFIAVLFAIALIWSLPHYALDDKGTYFKPVAGKYIFPLIFGFPLYLAWFLFPLFISLIFYKKNFKEFVSKKIKLIFSVVFAFGGIIAGLIFFNRFFPYFANIINSFGLSPKMLVGDPTGILPESFWILMTFFATFSLIILINSFEIKIFKKKENRFLLCFIIPYFLQIMAISFFLDRYLFLILPIVFLLVFQALKEKKFFPTGVIITIILFGAFSFVFTSEQISWNQVRWDLINELKEQGVPEDKIDGGMEYCRSTFGQDETRLVRSDTNIDFGICGKGCVEEGYAVSFKPIDGCSIVKSKPYYVLGIKFGEIFVLKK